MSERAVPPEGAPSKVAGGPESESPQGYEIAEPLSYEALPVGPSKEAVHGAREERWHDRFDEIPTVDAQNKDLFTPPAGAPSELHDEVREVHAAAAATTVREKRAIWIVHGMGQQIPFETVDGLSRGVLEELGNRAKTPRLRSVKIGEEILQRVEIDVDDRYELHLYETYWAPMTEGVAKLSDVVSFLWDGGTRGLLNCMKQFERAMFGGMARFRIPRRSALYLCLTLLVLAALTVINGVIITATAAKAKDKVE